MINILKPFVSLKIRSSEHFQIKSLKLWKDLNDDFQSPKSSKCRVWSFGNLTGWTQNMLKCPAWIAINSIGLKLRPEGLGIHIRASQKPFKNCFSAGRSRVYHMNSEGGWGVSSYPTNIKPSLFLGCSWVHFWIMVVVFSSPQFVVVLASIQDQVWLYADVDHESQPPFAHCFNNMFQFQTQFLEDGGIQCSFPE